MVSIEETFRRMICAHDGQIDKSGKPYWLHPLRVMLRLGPQATETERHAALLHDVVEDTPVTLENLRAQGYPAEVLEIVRLVSRDKAKQTYRQYINCIVSSGNRSAMRVKLADLNDNSSPARMEGLPPDMRGVMHRYRRSMAQIEAALPASARSELLTADASLDRHALDKWIGLVKDVKHTHPGYAASQAVPLP